MYQKEMEESSIKASLVYHAGQELRNVIDTDAAAALLDIRDTFHPRVLVIKKLIQAHEMKMPILCDTEC